MKRSKKSYKLDRAKIALTQKSELAYMRKIAKEVIKGETVFRNVLYSSVKIKRLAKAFLKATKKR